LGNSKGAEAFRLLAMKPNSGLVEGVAFAALARLERLNASGAKKFHRLRDSRI